MTNKELEKNFNVMIEKLRVVKKTKVVEFSTTIQADIDEFVGRGEVTKEKCEDYFGNLKNALLEKEAEIDIQIKQESDRIINEYLIKLKEFLKYEVNRSNEVKLTESVMSRSLDYLETAIANKAAEPKVDSEFSSRFDQILSKNPTGREVSTPVVEVAAVQSEIKTDLFDPASKISEEKSIDNAIDDLIAKVNIPEPEEQKVEEKVSTIDLEKLLEEVKSLV